MSGNNSLAHLRLCVTTMTLKDELQDAATGLMEDPTGYYKKLINASGALLIPNIYIYSCQW